MNAPCYTWVQWLRGLGAAGGSSDGTDCCECSMAKKSIWRKAGMGWDGFDLQFEMGVSVVER